jgi:hypothetical protein
LRTELPGIDEGFEALVARLLERDAAARFSSMREVGAALVPFASPEVRARWTSEFTGDERDLPAPQAVLQVSEHETSPTLRGVDVPKVVPGYVASPGVAGAVSEPSRRRWILAVAGGLSLASIAVIAAFLLRTPEPNGNAPAVVQQRLAAAVPDAAVTQVRENAMVPTPPSPTAIDAVRTPTPVAAVDPPGTTHSVAEPDAPRRGRHGRAERRPSRGGRRRRPVD